MTSVEHFGFGMLLLLLLYYFFVGKLICKTVFLAAFFSIFFLKVNKRFIVQSAREHGRVSSQVECSVEGNMANFLILLYNLYIYDKAYICQ